MDLNGLWAKLQADHSSWFLIAEVFIVVFFTLLLDFIQKRVVTRLKARAAATKPLWDDAMLMAVEGPLTWLIWLLGITFAAEVVRTRTDVALFAVIDPLRTIGVITLIVWFLIRIIRGMESNIVQSRQEAGRPVDQTTVDAIGKLLRVSVVITGALVALQSLGFSISGVLAFGGVGGIAVGFAAKDLLANFFGGLMVYMDRPFAVGEWIRSPDRNIEGTVEHIGWRLTRIRTFDKRPLYVPNATFTSIAVENPSRMSHRRIYETIGIRYDDATKMEPIIADVKAMLIQHSEIDETQTLIVNFNSFAPSSLDFFIYTFTHTTNWIHYHEVKQDVLLKIVAIIDNHGAEIAFPTSTLHLAEPVVLQHAGEAPADAR